MNRKDDGDVILILRHQARRAVQQGRACTLRRIMKSLSLIAEYVAGTRAHGEALPLRFDKGAFALLTVCVDDPPALPVQNDGVAEPARTEFNYSVRESYELMPRYVSEPKQAAARLNCLPVFSIYVLCDDALETRLDCKSHLFGGRIY